MCKLPSAHQIGDPVWVTLRDDRKVAWPDLKGHVRYVVFTTGKVRYGIRIMTSEDDSSTIHNIDSVFVKERTNGEHVKFEFDNLS
jgi:hypothetical protein